jgi:ribosome biogenesis GTPase
MPIQGLSHTSEPGCAVRTAIEAGELTEERFKNYQKLLKEIGYEGLNSANLKRKNQKNVRQYGRNETGYAACKKQKQKVNLTKVPD